MTRNRVIGLVIALAVFVLDQAVKWWVMGPLDLVGRSIPVLPFFNLTWTQNFGVSLGMLRADSEEMRWGLIALTSGIALVVLVWLLRERKLIDITALALILGGALGNILDRATLGYVVDYADLHIGEWRPFLIFNIADAAITFGVLIILARSFLSREKRAHPGTEPAHPAPES